MVNVVLVMLDGGARHALATALRAHPMLHVACATGEPDCIAAALDACASPVLVLDAQLVAFWLSSPPRAGRDAPRVLVCANDLDAPDLQRAIEHGVQGCLPRHAGDDAWRDAILAVAAGEYWIPRSLMARALVRLAMRVAPHEVAEALPDGLTPRQHDIVRAVAEGLSNKAIARRLGISPTTVKTHLQNIFERSGVHGRQQLAVQTLRRPREVEHSIDHDAAHLASTAAMPQGRPHGACARLGGP